MDTQNLKQRTTRQEPTTTNDESVRGAGQKMKRTMAKRGLKSLSIALTIPVILTLTNIYMFGTSDNYKLFNRPNWVPPIWALHMACLGSASLLCLCGWLVWAEGGFHKNPNIAGLYFGQFGLSLLWDLLMFKLGANWAGLLVAVGVCYGLYQCYRAFKQVSDIAADLVLPCLGWSALLGFISLKFMLN
ncbi:translocator protein homolog [Chenopodium quinoa]|uniref:Uncharacterized protein n=1 Tax=Chenopodium quinoa TaxID=63459 RepID=A0A803L9S8_CHEQI|nr:translocator protein homolog [Chenopodium quinoa]